MMLVKNIMSLLSKNGKHRGAHYLDSVVHFFSIPIIQIYYNFFYSINKNRIEVSNIVDEELIVSLTSFPDRIESIHYCIKSILRQTVKPTRVILWLAKEQFENLELPKKLLELKYYGLSIEFCDDIKSHKKYYYSMKKWPESIVVTVDDDVFYPENMLEELLASYRKYPCAVSCFRAHEMKLENDGSIAKYSNWGFTSPGVSGPSHKLFQTGVSGVLYPPGTLHKDVFDKNVFMEICKNADDLWLKIMALRSGTKVVKVNKYSKTMVEIPSSQNISLMSGNVINGKNDIQLARVIEYCDIDIQYFFREEGE
jgi:hypothetical protein